MTQQAIHRTVSLERIQDRRRRASNRWKHARKQGRDTDAAFRWLSAWDRAELAASTGGRWKALAVPPKTKSSTAPQDFPNGASGLTPGGRLASETSKPPGVSVDCGCGRSYSVVEIYRLEWVGVMDASEGWSLALFNCACRSTIALPFDPEGNPVNHLPQAGGAS